MLPDLDIKCDLSPSTFCFEARPNEALVLPPDQTARLDRSAMAREQIAQLRVLNIDFFPRESHLITFQDPWSFPILFHPACNNEIRKHMDSLAQKVGPHV